MTPSLFAGMSAPAALGLIDRGTAPGARPTLVRSASYTVTACRKRRGRFSGRSAPGCPLVAVELGLLLLPVRRTERAGTLEPHYIAVFGRGNGCCDGGRRLSRFVFELRDSERCLAIHPFLTLGV